MDCDALLAEHDENELREPFKPSERIAIAEAFEEHLRLRHGKNQHSAEPGQLAGSSDAGESRDLAAKKAGFGSGRTLERARQVLKKGTPEIIEAMGKAGAAIDKRPTAPTNPFPLT